MILLCATDFHFAFQKIYVYKHYGDTFPTAFLKGIWEEGAMQEGQGKHERRRGNGEVKTVREKKLVRYQIGIRCEGDEER